MKAIKPISSPLDLSPRISVPSTRQLILNYAVNFLDEHSEADLRVAVICRDVKVSVSSIYHYFGSREGIVVAAGIERYARSFAVFIGGIEPAVRKIESAGEFREFMLRTFHELQGPDGAAYRLKRVNIIGATMGRPELIESISEIEGRMIARVAEILRAPQERGWIRSDLDLKALSAWLIGSTFSRIVADFGGPMVSEDAWAQIAELALVSVVFGEEPAMVQDRLTA
jgi:AcrR family transcriptional regulator